MSYILLFLFIQNEKIDTWTDASERLMTKAIDQTITAALAGPPRYAVDPVAFVGALILAPVVATLLSFWTVIGLAALLIGAIPYLLIGTPLLLWAVGRVPPCFGTYATLGFCANLVPFGVFALMTMLDLGPREMAPGMMFIFGFGMIFGALWAGTFGWLYARFHRNFRILQT